MCVGACRCTRRIRLVHVYMRVYLWCTLFGGVSQTCVGSRMHVLVKKKTCSSQRIDVCSDMCSSSDRFGLGFLAAASVNKRVRDQTQSREKIAHAASKRRIAERILNQREANL